MAKRTLTKAKPIKSRFIDELVKAVSTPIEREIGFDDGVWIEKPVSVKKFCKEYLNEPLFPIQLKLAQAVTGKNPYGFSKKYLECHGFWGKGSGKDRTIAKIQLYIIYKLLCLKNPQRFLRENYRCSIADDDAIDIANMSINSRQAKNVYFKKFKAVLKNCVSPRTGKNWFEEKGVDLRDGYDIQEGQVVFPNMITAHSLNSETHTGEGLNLFLATVDEFGAFATDKAFDLLDAIRASIKSRFNRIGAVLVISYMYKDNDPMDILYRQGKDDDDVYSSRASTWKVNSLTRKEDFSKDFQKNPEKSKMTYGCRSSGKAGGYVTKKHMLNHMFDGKAYENPIIGNLESIEYSHLLNLKFKEWFKADTSRVYAVRFDLATGKRTEGNDCVGFSLVHPEKMYPKIDPKLRAELAKEGILIEMANDPTIARKGVVIDLHFQIVASKGDEIQLSTLREFVIKRLKEEMGFNIAFASYDNWQSKDSIQIMNMAGIQTEKISVDDNTKNYDDWKELMYQQLIKTYPNRITEREAYELVVNDKGKVDHPDKSWRRFKLEGVDKGSKDVMDAVVGAVVQAFEEIPVDIEVFFG